MTRQPPKRTGLAVGEGRKGRERGVARLDLDRLAPRVAAIRQALLKWGRKHVRKFPWRKTRNRYKALVAEILLHQTNVHKALPAYSQIVGKWPTPQDLAQADEQELAEIIRPLGFGYRARTLKALALTLVEEHSGRVPADKEVLVSLPGVGEYTASAVLSFTAHEGHPLVDAPISRTLARLFGLPPVPPDVHPSRDFYEVARLLIQQGNVKRVNLSLIDLAATVCTLKKPHCSQCPLAEWCAYFSTADKSQIR